MLIGVALIPWIIRHPRSAAGALRGAHDNALGVQSKTLSVGSWFAYFAGFAWPAVLTTFRRIAKWPRSPRLSDWS